MTPLTTLFYFVAPWQAAKRHTVIFVVIHNAEQAAAAKELGADVVVAQGS
jgi:NAD(P)H-dependent flavin oxidoreductase YrpB (nitropropane dioxygenase family)